MRAFLKNQLYRIDDNLAELQRLTIEQKELIIVRLRRGSDIAEEEAKYHELHVSLEELKRNRIATAKLLAQVEADYDALPSGMI